ncbi:MAG: InlB B-repeat-containing protein [Eubacteriales bacterium]
MNKHALLKKISSCFFAIALMAGILSLPINVFATDPVLFNVSNVSGLAGTDVTVSVNISANSYGAAIAINMQYDNTKLTYKSYTIGSAASGGMTQINPTYAINGNLTTINDSFIRDPGITAGGPMMNVVFTIKTGWTGSTPLTLAVPDLYNDTWDELTSVLTNGSVSITVPQHLITFNANGGTGGTSGLMDEGAVLNAPAVTKTGYSLSSWLPSVPATVPNTAATYVAQWAINQYSVTFDSAGGSAVGTITQNYNTAVAAPTPPTKAGYTFVGWLPVVPTTMPATVTNCVAQWNINQHTITFDANGGTGGTSGLMNEGATLNAPAVKRAGYGLSGWLPSVPATVPNATATYTAQWTKTEIGLTKTESGFTVNIKGWNASDKYQIWSYQKITSDIFLNTSTDVKANQWILSKEYTLGSAGVVQEDGSINFAIDSFVSPDNNYTVAVRILDDSNKFIGVLMDSFTRTEVSEVEITKVLVDGVYSTGRETKEIKPAANVFIKVISNGLVNTTYTAQVLETLSTLDVSNTNEFVWDISGLLPRTYTIRVTIANNVSISTRDILFVLYKVSGVTYAEIGNMTLDTYNKIGTGNITITPNFNSGNNRYFYYKISEPERVAYLTSPLVTSNAAITQDIAKYGTYNITGYANRQEIDPSFNFYDDGIIKTLQVKRNSTPDTVTLSADKTLNPITKGEPIVFTGNASIDGLSSGETLQYSFWRYDAMGFVVVKDWSASNTLNWTPGKIGVYRIEVRARGSLAGSYEAVNSLLVNVVNSGETLVTVSSITIGSLAGATARVPIDIMTSVTGANNDDLLYKFYATDADMGIIQLQNYSANPNCTWTPRKAGQYTISVWIKSKVSFGKYDASQGFNVTVN